MALAKDKIVFGDLNITLKIYDIRDGESGRKPCFLQMKSDIKLNREINKKEQLARALNNRSLNPSPTKGESKTSPNGVDDSQEPDDFSDDEADPIRVIFAGGDGTIMWGMMELGEARYQIKQNDLFLISDCTVRVPLRTYEIKSLDLITHDTLYHSKYIATP